MFHFNHHHSLRSSQNGRVRLRFQVYAQQIKMCRDTARAMCYLHTFNPMIIHRDLKSLNMLLDAPVTGDDALARLWNVGNVVFGGIYIYIYIY